MKILHTSDWHLGQNFYGYDRSLEHKAFLEQLLGIVYKEKPDVMLVSGDIFHNYTPSAEAQRLFTDSLVDIHNSRPEMPIIITAGNHDSASRIEVDSGLWRIANVHVIGRLNFTANGDIDFASHFLSIGSKGFVMPMPYIFGQSYPADPEGKDNRRYFFSLLNKYVEDNNRVGLPIVLMAHLAVRGSDLKGQRIKGVNDNIGGIDFMPMDDFGTVFDYVALGHIHHAQTIAGSGGRIRYSGSPIPVSFDEDYQHSVSIVDVEHGRKPAIKEIAIDNPCPLLTIPKKPKRTPLAIEALQKEVPAKGRCYVRLNPEERHAFPASMEEDAITTLRNVNSEAMYTTFVPNITKTDTTATKQVDITPQQLVAMEPIDIARQYFDMQQENFDEYEDLFLQVINRINEENAK